MISFQILFLLLLFLFYAIYFAKMLILKKQGIEADLLGKGNKLERFARIEIMLKTTTWIGAIIQFISTIFPNLIWSFNISLSVYILGIALGFTGVIFFFLSVLTMKNNWRAGFDSTQKTQLVTNGIYKISRNPAFIGFDLLYVGCAFVFPNILNILAALTAVIAFHIQILSEEKFLAQTFGKAYLKYKSNVRRYL